MPLTSATKILNTLKNNHAITKTLKNLKLQHTPSGQLFYHVGNNVVLFKIEINNKWHTMRCYMQNTKFLHQIYGDKYLPQELYICASSTSGYWIDVVIDEWIEGETLLTKIEEAVNNNDSQTLTSLADNFDKLATHILQCEWAHGDLTPENIIVTPSGELKLIDFDGMFLPQLTGEESTEVGTAAYQSPLRTTRDFGRHIDDYSIALISTALRAIAIEPNVYKKFTFRDGLMIEPQKVFKGTSKALDYILQLFADKNMNSAYRVAKLLTTPTLHFVHLHEILRLSHLATPSPSPLYVTICGGMIGYSTAEGEVFIPHIYDDGIEFRRGEVAVNLDGRWMKLDHTGQVVRVAQK